MSRPKPIMGCLLGILLALGVPGSLRAAQEMPKFNLRLQSHLPPEQSKRVLTKFLEMVSDMSGGRMKVTAFPGGAIVPSSEMLEAVGKGAIDMGLFGEGYWYKIVPVSEIAQGLPFSFRDSDEARFFMLRKGFGDMLRKAYAKHNVYHMPFETYPVGLMTKNPVTKAEDLKGLKLRSFGTMAAWLGKMGASTVMIPGGELYTAFATGVVDGGHWGDAGPMYEIKFHEVLKNYMLPEPIIGSWNSLIVNMDLWNKFTAEQKAIVEAAVLGGGMAWCNNETRMLSKRALQEMTANWKVSVNVLPEAEIEKMRKASMELWDEIAGKDPLCAEAIKSLKAFLKELK